jgi:hypothetical protein
MRPWLPHIVLASATVATVVAGTFWIVQVGLPSASRSEVLADSVVVQVILLAFGVF